MNPVTDLVNRIGVPTNTDWLMPNSDLSLIVLPPVNVSTLCKFCAN